MKRLALLAFMAVCAFAVQAQSRKVYAKIVSYNETSLSRTKALIDYGKGYVEILDERDKERKLSGIVEALNMMAEQGWTLVTSYSSEFSVGRAFVGQNLSPVAQYYIMCKDISTDDEITQGLHLSKPKEPKERKETKPGVNDMYGR